MASHLDIDVTLCSDEDIPTCFQIISKSFAHNSPFVDISYPNHDTPSGQAKGSKRLLAWKKEEPTSYFLRATTRAIDSNDERIIGLAIWTYMKEPPPSDIAVLEDVEDVWPDENDREFMKRMWREFVVPRSQAVEQSGGKGVFGNLKLMIPTERSKTNEHLNLVLDILAVDPDYHRQGVGAALVEWGTKAADERGIEAVVEATHVGRRLYEKNDFSTVIEEMVFDVGERFDDRRKPNIVFMKRSARS
ncbi:MAG: hypothetical protein M1820_006601 [Bogoriella megaspora]|nr:MAG: hypothetical protein M1820_006601 [Bogoriella megaspora]